ncbi:MAG: hypothetical protein F6K32_22360, partial [Desertifilum sp. SIO1I2]|nr:hypothetical protein [Desertifilum sp. SIO1I2]
SGTNNLNLGNLTLTLDNVLRNGKDLVIDTNKNGQIDDTDLKIANFFNTPNSTFSNIGNLNGDDVVAALNTPPTAVNDSATATSGTAVNIDVLANDTDPDEGDVLSIVSFTQPTNGTVELNNNNTPNDPTDDFLVYTPGSNFVGTDTFTYIANDGTVQSQAAQVTIEVSAPASPSPRPIPPLTPTPGSTPAPTPTPGTIQGTPGDDNLIGIEGNDTIDGSTGNDAILGLQGDDSLLGGEGNDAINGNQGADTINGGPGDDVLLGGKGDDSILGGEGNDVLAGNNGNDILEGGAGNDILFGNRGNDILRGGEGDDLLYGGRGNDILFGGAGNDTLVGDRAQDILYGGSGNDIFVLRLDGAPNDPADADVIQDYEAGDRIGLTGGLTVQDLAFLTAVGNTVITVASTGAVLGVVLGASPQDLSFTSVDVGVI